MHLETVAKSAFTFRSDVPAALRARHRCGILHAARAEHGREEHAFAWLDDRFHEKGVADVVEHLKGHGFRSHYFIPYGRREDWVHRYPHACPYIECNAIGRIKGVAYFPQCINSGQDTPTPPQNTHASATAGDASSSSRPTKRQKRQSSEGPKLIPSATLTDDERSQLHIEIYNYFSWLHSELTDLETTDGGRLKVRRKGLSVPGVQNILAKMEKTFKDVGEYKAKKGEEGEDGDANDNDETAKEGREHSEKESDDPKTPMLEERLKPDLGSIVEKMQQQSKAKSTQDGHQQSPKATSRSFETMYAHLVAYKEAHGNVNVIQKHRTDDGTPLGRWVSDLRKSKRLLRASGLEHEPIDAANGWAVGVKTVPVPAGRLGLTVQISEHGRAKGAIVTKVQPTCPFKDEVQVGDRLVSIDGVEVKVKEDLVAGADKEVRMFGINRRIPGGSTFLSLERVERLDALGFAWESQATKNQMTWEQRFNLLKEYKETRGHWPGRLEKWNSLGNWIYNQRKAYTQKDRKFMEERAPRLEEIGFPWRLRDKVVVLQWEDYVQKLVEFGRVNKHFEVPRPADDDDDDEAVKFHRWIQALHTGYRAYQQGRPSKLNQERIQQLLDLGFQFKEKEVTYVQNTYVNVPDIPFEQRLEQVQKYRDEMGHLTIDHRHKDQDNFGGWAANVSRRYHDWQEGAEISPLEEHQFDQLSALGFGFDVLPTGVRERRSWQDNFDAFVKFVETEGHVMVPRKYKADRRLGTWVAFQRKEYKLWQEGKKSQMTQERFDTLQSYGFVWEATGKRRGSSGKFETQRP